MEKYLGVKLIEAEYWPDSDGYNIIDDGDSILKDGQNGQWTSRDLFEKAYRKIKTLDDLSNPFNNYDIDSSQWRTVNEAKELDNKILQLENYLRIPELCANENEFSILKQQLISMQYYLTILVERIENFK